jgi:hypothetical protein
MRNEEMIFLGYSLVEIVLDLNKEGNTAARKTS